jgi:hypothetical protein
MSADRGLSAYQEDGDVTGESLLTPDLAIKTSNTEIDARQRII